ncbi:MULTISPECIES: helix-turn-helix domain-containing protein [unclassified Micromonospora]|uniref:helix-turn-helix domain-containing protein n=1 Tax=unclassified Micromonospora TaxID=2617518 RepID=UPI003A8755F0
MDVDMWIKAFKAARAAADVSQDQLAPKINYSASTIAAVETGRRRPTMTLAAGADEALDTGGLLAEMLDLINKKQAPSWFASWRAIEDRAVKLRMYEPLLVPGLLQTEEYARAVFTGTGLYTADGVEDQVAMRLDRQRLLAREKPPVLVAVVDEGALRRIVGDTVVQREQLNYLLTLMNERRIKLYVVPLSAGAYAGMSGGFVIGTLPEGDDVVHVDGVFGHPVDHPSGVEQVVRIWDSLLTEALPERTSRELIEGLVKEL